MSEKVVIINDPGIDGAFAVALALHDPAIEVVGLLATAGNVGPEQATCNVRVLLDRIDPPRYPRLGAAPPADYPGDGKRLHGPKGLGATDFPCAPLHNLPNSDKVLAELVRQNPHELTVLCLGPMSVVAQACDLNPDLPAQVKRIVAVGGTLREPGNAGPVSEFHVHCDPAAARKVLRCGAPLTLVPLDQMRRVLFSPTDLLGMPEEDSPTAAFLRQIVPFGIAATSSRYGIEGFHLKDVLGVLALSRPEAMRTERMRADVEVQGELTRGMVVFDRRPWVSDTPNVDVAVEVEAQAVREYIKEVLNF